jgi:hypothetical protein
MNVERAIAAGEPLNIFAYLRLKDFAQSIKHKPHTLVLDITMDPLAFKWPVKGQSITLCATDETLEHARRWARALAADGAELVALCTTSGKLSFYKRLTEELPSEAA